MGNLSSNSSYWIFGLARCAEGTSKRSVLVIISGSLWLLLMIFQSVSGGAQSVYNKLYTLQSRASSFDAVAPHGSSGACMVAATVIDSSTGKQAIRIARVDASGIIESSRYYNVPDDTARMIYVNYKAMTRVHDNCYAMVGTVLPKVKQYSFILLADSNGQVYRCQDILLKDSFNYLSDIRYDGWGNLIVGGKRITSTASDLVIGKFDTSLNQLWIRSYHPGALFVDQLTQNLMIDSSGYVLCGGGQNAYFSDDKAYACQAFLFKTDTSGNEKWIWTSRTSTYGEYQSHIGAALHTLDGGYLYTTMGHTYNRVLPSAPVIRLEAKQLIIKLDSARNKQWEVVLDDYYYGFGYVRANLIEFPDSTFLFLGNRTTDSLSPDLKPGKFVLELYSNKGMLLRQRIINKYLPRSVDDTHKESGGPIYDIRQTADKGFVLCGYYENRTAGAPAPTQRAWLLKLDSNLCLGVGDSQCIPSAIAELPAPEEDLYTLHPNPGTGSYVLSCASWSGVLIGSILEVCDITGRLLVTQRLIAAETKLDLNSVSNGVYFYRIVQNGKVLYHGKLIKQ